MVAVAAPALVYKLTTIDVTPAFGFTITPVAAFAVDEDIAAEFSAGP
jgi:hypothetical protein